MAFKDYSSVPASNTLLDDGTYIGPNMFRNKVRPALQQIVADGKLLADEVTALGTLKGDKGDPGANVMAIGLFTGASALSIPVGTDLVRTAGYAAKGGGFADLVADAAVDAAYVAANPRSSFISANGRGFRIVLDQRVTPLMLGAAGDGVTDDSAALRAWIALDAREHAVGGPSQTFIVAPATVGAVILPFTKRRTIRGEGATIKVKNASGQFYGILGSASSAEDLSGTEITGIIFDHNKGGNTYTASSNVLTQPHFTFVARAGFDIEVSDNTILDAVCTNSIFLNGADTVGRAVIRNNKWLRTGGSATTHDHSTIYVTGVDADISGNRGYAAAFDATGAACFIETHCTKLTGGGNHCEGYDGFANICGIFSGGDVEDSVFADSSFDVRAFGIRLFSTTSGAHTSGYGIKGLLIDGVKGRIRQSGVTGSNKSIMACAFQPGSSLPVKNVRITNVYVEYDEENTTTTYTSIYPAIGAGETSGTTQFENITISNCEVINAPGPAFALGISGGKFVNCEIDPATCKAINPGQSQSVSYAAYKVGIWCGGRYEGWVKVGATILDTFATSRLVHGAYFGPAADSTAAHCRVDVDVVLAGATTTSFSRVCANVGAFIKPLVTAKLNKAPAFTSATFKAGSIVRDTANDLDYRVLTEGVAWTTHGYANAAPATGTHQVGSTRTYLAPAVGGALGTVCVTAGTPGTWSDFGIIGAARAATQAASVAVDVAGVVADLNALIAKLKTAKLMA